MEEHPSLQRAREIRDRAQAREVQDLLSYWIAIHPGDRIPARAAFDPMQIPRLLPNLVLTDVERDPYRFRVRLMGTGIVEGMGGDFTGRYLDGVWPDAGNQPLVRDRVEVAETGLPNYRYGRSPTPFKLDFAALERAFLPFAANGTDVDVILSVIVYMRPPPET
jgi:hypothetical protein